MQECRDASTKLLELIWVDTDKSVNPAHKKKIRSRLRATEHKTKKPGNTQTALPASQLCSTMPPPEAVKQLVSIMMFVGWSNTGKHLKLRHYDISAEHIFKEEPRESYTSDLQQKIVRNMGQTKVVD